MWSKRAKLVLLCGAPLAFAGALWFQRTLDRERPIRLSIDRAEAVELARQAAAKAGVNPTGWTTVAATSPKTRLANFYRKTPYAGIGKMRALLTELPIQVLFVRPDGQQWFRVMLAPDGKVQSYYRFGSFQQPPNPAPPDRSRYLAMAEAAARALIPPGLTTQLGDPEVQMVEGSSDAGATRFIWHADIPDVAGLDVDITAEVRHGLVTRLEVTPIYVGNESDAARDDTPFWQQLTTIGRLILLLLITGYGCYRYARRARDKEAPHIRTLVLTGTMLVFGLVLIIVEPNLIRQEQPDRYVGGFAWFLRVIFVSWIAIQGLLLGLAYGAGEGEIREVYPGKLTSLDALTLGKIFSANVAWSVLTGVATAAWALLFYKAFLVLTGAWPDLTEGFTTAMARLQWLLVLVSVPITGVLGAVCGLLLPIMFLRRKVKKRRVAAVLLGAAALLLVNPAESLTLGNPASVAEHALAAAALLIPFYALDFLSAIVAVGVFSFGHVVPDLAGATKSWQHVDEILYSFAAATLGVLLIAAWRGRRYAEDEVRPQYARNLAQRLSMQAELGAAREAQLRLLPERPPQIPGLSIAASCTPAREVSGDYYDFFALPGGLLGVAIAEGGNDGLASALTIALTKGFLMVETARESSPQAVLEALRAMLGGSLRRSGADTTVLYAVIDPHRRQLNVARTGEFPYLLCVDAYGRVRTIEDGEQSLSAHDSLIFFTDGVPRWLESQAVGTPEDLLRRIPARPEASSAESLHQSLLQLFFPARGRQATELLDDLTTVIVRVEETKSSELERVA